MPKKRSESGLLPHTVASAERGVEPDPEYLYLYLHLACGATSSTERPPVTTLPGGDCSKAEGTPYGPWNATMVSSCTCPSYSSTVTCQWHDR